MTEYIIEVDKNNRRIGLRPHADFYTGKYIGRGAHLLLFNSHNEILLQRRAPTKQWYPDLLTYSVSGTVADESYESCIRRETQEEIGIAVAPKKLFTYPFFGEDNKAWHCLFESKSDDEIVPDPKEVSDIIWISPEKLQRDIYDNPHKYTPPFVVGMKKYFAEYYQT